MVSALAESRLVFEAVAVSAFTAPVGLVRACAGRLQRADVLLDALSSAACCVSCVVCCCCSSVEKVVAPP